MAKFTFCTKAQTLDKLAKSLSKSNVLPLKYFTIAEYKKAPLETIENIIKTFKSNVIVRSSTLAEDRFNNSNAGHFKTVMNVKRKAFDLKNAIDVVVESYKNTKKNNEVLIQPMLKNIKYSGVVFTCDIDTMAPYYIINYSVGNDTSLITSGVSNEYKTTVIYKKHKTTDVLLKKLLAAVQEIEKFCSNDKLDIEFAIDSNDNVFIFQVRPIVVKQNTQFVSKELLSIYKKIDGPFSVMSDWNPAEMLGMRPHRLALSLYMYLITDDIWAQQRYNYGYRDLRKHPLLKPLAGIPYIDIRADLESFIPAKLDDNIANKLLNYYIDKLYKNPQLHDKIEFEIVLSCAHFNLDYELSRLHFSGRVVCDIKNALIELTNNIIKPDGYFQKDLKKIGLLDTHFSKVASIKDCLETIKEYGTLTFAGIARSAFVATKILKSLVEVNIISEQDLSNFMSSIPLPSHNMRKDLSQMSKKEFLKRWGHLRPNTYEITSKKYSDSFDKYFQYSCKESSERRAFNFTKKQMDAIDVAVKKLGLCVSGDYLIDFIKNAISGRETAKLIFTKYVSFLLDSVSKYASKRGISVMDISNADIKDILKNRDIFKSVRRGKKDYEHACMIKLPELILNPADVYQFNVVDDIPNFVTQKRITAEVIKEQDIVSGNCKGKIALVASADPGYDFLFSRGIVGLVTMFGGANSHMVIRCSEYGLPAAIGIGEKKYNIISGANAIEIDSLNKTIKVIS
ncbi:MAG: hypothetical protein J6W79_03255 [Alphaproteobacteria bacterium]|nr:hypothetical protein [Alphaproteobacteria bacterium]